MTWKNQWTKWSTHKELPSQLKKHMNEMTESEREDAFYKQLEFGTGGMRGELGAGPNRMNIYTVRKFTAGLAAYIEENGTEAKEQGVVIAYDSRHGSAEFALEAAKTLGAYGIKSYVFEELRPTPELSFAVRYLRVYAGIMITASHNPSEYNGYKVYGEDGAQLPPAAADVIVTHMNEIENELLLEIRDERELLSQNLVSYIGENLDQVYLDYVKGLQLNKDVANLHIVYTPLHGTGQTLMPQALQNAGFQHITIVDEQKDPDPNFLTVSSPNPEEAQAFQLAIQYGKETGAAVEKIEDYQIGKRTNLLTAQQETMDLPSSNVLKFWLQDGSWFAIRPSGTEPKVKFYFGVKQGTEGESEERLKEVKTSVINIVKEI